MLEVNQLSFSRNDRFLFSNLSFAVSPGQALQVLAGNGVGKTSLLKVIAGLLRPEFGTIKLGSGFCYLGHKNNLHPALTPLENLSFLTTADPASVQKALQFINLQAQKNIPCAELSAGQLQRLHLARLYLSANKLWLLDEPTVNLDAQSKNILLNLCLQHLVGGGSIVLATHNLLEIPGNVLELEHYV